MSPLEALFAVYAFSVTAAITGLLSYYLLTVLFPSPLFLFEAEIARYTTIVMVRNYVVFGVIITLFLGIVGGVIANVLTRR